MNKFIIGVVLGTAMGFCARRLQEKGYLDGMCDAMSDFASKAKRDVKNVMDKGMNEAEYVKDRAGYMTRKGKEKLDEMME